MPEFPVLRDIAERPEPVDYLPWIMAGGGGVLVLAVLAFLLLPKWLRDRRRPTTPAVVDAATAAIAQLRKLELEPASESSDVASRVQHILRTYLHRGPGALGLYRTADELLGRGEKDAPPPNPRLAPFADVLRRAEALRYGGSDVDTTALIASAIAALEAEPAPPSPAGNRAEP